jgi:hypothetical protein
VARSPLRLALHDWGGPRSPKPVATTAAADFSLRRSADAIRRLPFRSEARSPQVRRIGCPCTSAGFTWLPLIARASRSIARSPWSAPPRIRFLYVAPQVSLAASFSDSLTVVALRFTRVGAIASPQDSHLLVNAHAGHTIGAPAVRAQSEPRLTASDRYAVQGTWLIARIAGKPT